MSTWISSLPLTPDFFPILEIFMYTDIFVHNGFSFSSLLLYTFEDKYFRDGRRHITHSLWSNSDYQRQILTYQHQILISHEHSHKF